MSGVADETRTVTVECRGVKPKSSAERGIAQLHELHRAVLTGAEVDALAPLGKWKVLPNGTNALTSKGTSKWHD